MSCSTSLIGKACNGRASRGDQCAGFGSEYRVMRSGGGPDAVKAQERLVGESGNGGEMADRRDAAYGKAGDLTAASASALARSSWCSPESMNR